MYRFYFIGSLIFGGGHVVIPMTLADFAGMKLISEGDVLNGFWIVSFLPGPVFNLAGYVGTRIEGIYAGFISAFCIFAPGILLMLGCMPYYGKIKKNKVLRTLLNGISLAAIGFIFTAGIKLWIDTCYKSIFSSVYVGTLAVVTCYLLLIFVGIFAPLMLLCGGAISITGHCILQLITYFWTP